MFVSESMVAHNGLTRNFECEECLEGQAIKERLLQVNPIKSLMHIVLQGVPPAIEVVTPAKAVTS